MSYEVALTSILRGDEQLTALGATVRPLTGAQKDQRPLVTYELSDEEAVSQTMQAQSATKRRTIEIGLLADTYAEVIELGQNVGRILPATVGTVEGVIIAWIRANGESDIEQGVEPGTDKPVFVRTQSYRTLYRAAT